MHHDRPEDFISIPVWRRGSRLRRMENHWAMRNIRFLNVGSQFILRITQTTHKLYTISGESLDGYWDEATHRQALMRLLLSRRARPWQLKAERKATYSGCGTHFLIRCLANRHRLVLYKLSA
jgi:hypothetical protein